VQTSLGSDSHQKPTIQKPKTVFGFWILAKTKIDLGFRFLAIYKKRKQQLVCGCWPKTKQATTKTNN
jgi:hypothetical protein